MMTEKYVNLFHYFYKSFRKNNQHKIICYCVNFNPDLKMEGVEFIPFKGEFERETDLNPDGVLKVTHLKSHFLDEVAQKHKKNVLWIDCSKLILGSIDFIDLEKHDWVGIKRKTTKPNKVYFAGLFGFSKNSKNLKLYKELCTKDKDNWFNDQKALNELDKTNYQELEYDKYVSGEVNIYNPNYLIVRALAYKGLDKFQASEKYFKEMLEEPKPAKKNILAYMHNPGEDWCFLSGINNIKKYSKHNITIVDSVNNANYLKTLNPDIVWSRGGIYLMKFFMRVRPDLKGKIIHTLTHGNEMLTNRIYQTLPWANGTLAIVTQNLDGKVRMEFELMRKDYKVPVYFQPNAVDTDLFKVVEPPKEFVAGFVGRNANPKEADLKGWHLFYMASRLTKVKILEASNSAGKRIPYAGMHKFYNQLSCMVLPSFTEGCSNTVLEAQASGLPVITTKVGYHAEVGKDFEDIIFCTRSVHDIKEKIEWVRDNPQKAREIGLNARKFAERHHPQIIAKSFDNMFDELCKS